MPKLILLLLSSMLLLSGCKFKHDQNGPAAPQSIEETTSSFYLADRNLKLSATSKYGAFGLIPDQILEWKACLNTYSTNEPIIGHKFSVVTKDKLIKDELISEDDGCIYWTETIKPNPISQPKYLMLDRFIRSQGVQRGYIKVSMAINPWSAWYSSGSPLRSVIDPSRNQSLPSDILYGEEAMLHLTGDHMFSASFKYEDKPTLWINNLDINVVDEGLIPGDKGKKSVQISFSPKVLVKDYLGNEIPMDVQEGEFDVVPYIFGRMESGEFAKVATLKTKDSKDLRAKFKAGRVSKTFNFVLEGTVDGRYELGISITPVNGPKHLRKFEGAFVIGSFRELDGKKTISLLSEFSNSIYSEYNLSDYTNKLTDDLSKFLPVKWSFSSLSIRFYGVDANLETNTERVVYFKAQTCISHPTRHAAAFNKDFKILMVKLPWESEDERKVAHVKTLGQTGCIEWQDRVWHSVYDIQKPIVASSTFIGPNNSRTELPFAINPWTTAWSFGSDGRFLNQIITTNEDMKNYCYDEKNDKYDCSQLDENKIERMSDRSKPARQRPEAIGQERKPEMFIRSFKFQRIGQQHLVNHQLDMKLKLNYRLTLDPYVLRPDSFDRGNPEVEPLRNGLYLLRMVLMTDGYIKERFKLDSKVLSTWQNVVKVRNGLIITDMDLFIQEHVALNHRASVYFQILPLDERLIYQDPSFMDALGIKFSNPNKLNDYYSYYKLDKAKLKDYQPSIKTFEKGSAPIHSETIEKQQEMASNVIKDFLQNYDYDNVGENGYLTTFDESSLEEFEKRFFIRLHRSKYAANLDKFIERTRVVYKRGSDTGVKKNIFLKPLIFYMKVVLNQDQMTGNLLSVTKNGSFDDIGQLWGREVFETNNGNSVVSSDVLASIIKKERDDYFKNLVDNKEYISKDMIYENQAKKDLKEFIKDQSLEYFEVSDHKSDIFGSPKKELPFSKYYKNSKKLITKVLFNNEYRFEPEIYTHNIKKAEPRISNNFIPTRFKDFTLEKSLPDSKDLATFLCKYMYSEYSNDILNIPKDKFFKTKLDYNPNDITSAHVEKSEFYINSTVGAIDRTCRSRPLELISIDKFYYSHTIDQENVKLRQGFSQNFNIHSGYNMGLTGYDSVYKNRTVSLTGNFGIDLLGFNALSKNLGNNGKFLIDGKAGLSWSKDFSAARAQSGEMRAGDSLTFTSGMYLVVLNSKIDLPLKSYQTCMNVKINKEGFFDLIRMAKKYNKWSLERLQDENISGNDEFQYIYNNILKEVFVNSELRKLFDVKKENGVERLDVDERDIAKFLDSGMLICSDRIDVPENESHIITEDYYMIYQHFKSFNSQQDPGDTRNDAWLTTLRGAADYKKFMHMIYHDGPKTASPCQIANLDHNTVVLDLLKYSYRNRTPSLNRIYHLLPNEDLSQYQLAYEGVNSFNDIVTEGWNPFSWQSWGQDLAESIKIDCTSN